MLTSPLLLKFSLNRADGNDNNDTSDIADSVCVVICTYHKIAQNLFINSSLNTVIPWFGVPVSELQLSQFSSMLSLLLPIHLRICKVIARFEKRTSHTIGPVFIVQLESTAGDSGLRARAIECVIIYHVLG